jgi:hypothetical protein
MSGRNSGGIRWHHQTLWLGWFRVENKALSIFRSRIWALCPPCRSRWTRVVAVQMQDLTAAARAPPPPRCAVSDSALEAALCVLHPGSGAHSLHGG